MIQNKADLKMYLKMDAEANNESEKIPRIVGGYKKKLTLFRIYLRKCEYWTNSSSGYVSKFIAKYYSVRSNRLAGQLGFSIPVNGFGPGLSIPHYGTIVVNVKAKVGSNCTLLPGVTIGRWGETDDVPVVGDYCYMGAGAKIIGRVTIGNHVTIGANAVVVRDVPDNAVVAGVPAKIVGWNDPGE